MICFDHWNSSGRHFEMWRSCVAVPDTHSYIAIVFIKSKDWNYNARTSHFKMAARNKIKDQNKSLGREFYQIWAADVDTSWGKLLFEINIIRQPRFPLSTSILGIERMKMKLCFFVHRNTKGCHNHSWKLNFKSFIVFVFD